MRVTSAAALYAAASALLLASTALAASKASSSDGTEQWCTDSRQNVLTMCGCSNGVPCVQYGTSSPFKCTPTSANKCSLVQGTSCTYQCLRDVYNTNSNKWTVLVQEPPPSSEGFSAPITKISGVTFPQGVTAIQLNGFADYLESKGQVQLVSFPADLFSAVPRLNFLSISNINFGNVSPNFFPTNLATLNLPNCKLDSVPADIATLTQLESLDLAANNIKELPGNDRIERALAKLTTLNLSNNYLSNFSWNLVSLKSLDLQGNQLESFPTSILDLPQLSYVKLDNNNFKTKTIEVSQAQFDKIKSFLPNSTLGVETSSGGCPKGSKEERVLSTYVCVTGDAKSSGGGGTSTTVVIICSVVGAVLILGALGYYLHRRRSKLDAYRLSSPQDTNYSSNNRRGSNMAARPNRAASQPRVNRTGSVSTTGGANTGGTGGYGQISEYSKSLMPSEATNQSTGAISRKRQTDAISKSVVRLNSDDIIYTRRIAKGAFGEVWLAHHGRDVVAVKKLLSSDKMSVDGFIAELNLLASFSHPRIVSLIGACWDDQFSDLQIITEYMDSGDLLTVLRDRPSTELTWRNGKQNYCLQVCEALQYLHSLQPPLIHRDIKSRNVLVDERKGAKLTDFGESRERTIQNTMTAGVGTARWVAPEIILGEDYSELADIYSFGVLLTELDSHEIPYQGMQLEESMIVQQVAVGKLRPKVTDTCPEVIRRLAHECLQFDPTLRPTAARVLQTLMSSSLIRGDAMSM